MKAQYFKNFLTILISLICLHDTKLYFVHSMDYTNCNKLWGVTQDANGKMLYKVGMYMCVEDPYNIYKNAYSSQIDPPLLLENPQPNNITVNNSNNTIQNVTNISPKIGNETKNVSIINETFFKIYNKTLNTSTVAQTTPTLSTTTRQITTPIIPTTTTVSPTMSSTTTQQIITTAQQTRTTPRTTTKSQITYTEVLNKSTNKTNKSYGFTNLRSSADNEKQKETSKKDEVDVILIVVICCIVVILNIIGVVVYIKCKKDTINKKKDQTKVQDEMNTQDNPTDKNIMKQEPKQIKVKPNNNIPLNKQHKPPINLSVDTNKGKELKLNHNALTPNTKQILNESEASIKNWYKKTFQNELKECGDDVPMPPVSKVYPLSQNKKQPNHKTSSSNAPVLKKNVKKLINVHEMKIKEAQRTNRNIPTNHYNRQHNVLGKPSSNQPPNYQIQYLNNRGQSSHQNNNFAK